ncbi:MAG: hypothetical protein ACO1OB_10420 [Archangium sp.]
MSDDLSFYPHPLGLEFRHPPFSLTAIWVEFLNVPHRSHYSVSIFEDDAGDIWAASFKTLDEAKASFEQRKRELEQGIVPEMPEHQD